MEEQVPSTSSTSQNAKEINILLLGETGVGKSTFINSFVNYLQHTTFNNALSSELACLIPLKFTVPNENYEDRVIEFGQDNNNEDTVLGNSSTQGAKSYLFPVDEYTVRIIDTPGIGDARGIEQDDKNFENVLAYISQYKHLHGICFLLKPNVSVINAYFKFCIVHLLSRLEKSAANNIVFVFTNSRGTFYRPGETLPLLKRILKEIKDTPPHVDVPCSRQNMFCVDNEAFKFLIAKKNGITFDGSETKEFAMSWKTSYKTCREILAYICGTAESQPLQPHELQNTISVNRARKIITDLSKPLADVCDLIQDNLMVLKRHEKVIQEEELSREDLLSKLHVPTIELEVQQLNQPVTVCTASKCSEIYTCGELNKYHYKQRCHNPCYLNNVPREIIGAPELMHCAAMAGAYCKQCGCQYSVHMHIYYESRVKNSKQEDVSIKQRIKTKEDEINAKQLITQQLMDTRKEYEYEKEEISKCMAKFAHFLKENSISAYNDAYIDYLDYLIEREKLLGDQKDQERIKNYNSLKSQYQQEKRILDDLVQNARLVDTDAKIVNESDIADIVQFLYNLKHTGAKISHLHSIQQKSITESIYSQEYTYPKRLKNTTDNIEVDSSSSELEEEKVDSLLNSIVNLMKTQLRSTKKKRSSRRKGKSGKKKFNPIKNEAIIKETNNVEDEKKSIEMNITEVSTAEVADEVKEGGSVELENGKEVADKVKEDGSVELENGKEVKENDEKEKDSGFVIVL